MVVVDDALLLAVLVGRPTGPSNFVDTAAGRHRGEVFTTGSWYWRLARALARPGAGALSRRLASMTEDERRRAESAMAALPAEIGMLGLRAWFR